VISSHYIAQSSLQSSIVAASVTLVFAGLARLLRGVSWSGALAGAGVSFLLYSTAGLGAFIGLVSLFAMTLSATKVGYARKQRLGTAERGEGRRASQILANLGVATAAAVISKISQNPLFLLATVAAMAEAAADTTSSEIGQAGCEPVRLITNFEEVPAGTDGGVTIAGILAGVAAAVLMSSVFALVGLIPAKAVAVATLAGVLGMLIDSVLGASLERRKMMNNDAVNLFGTLSAALIATLLRALIPS
jgi:uncharacterized protein (TIGR00297 family)